MRHFYKNHWYVFFVYLSSFSSLQTSIDLFVQSKIVSEYDKGIPQSQTADRLVHARVHECLPGGGSRPDCQKTALTTFVLVLNLFYSFTVVYQWFISKKTIFPRFRGGPTFCRGVQHFPGGFKFFQGGGGGGKCVCIDTDRTCDFPGGDTDRLSPYGSAHACGTAIKSHKTITRHQKDKQSKATSSLIPIKISAKLEWTQSNEQQNIEQLQNPTMGATINNDLYSAATENILSLFSFFNVQHNYSLGLKRKTYRIDQ